MTLKLRHSPGGITFFAFVVKLLLCSCLAHSSRGGENVCREKSIEDIKWHMPPAEDPIIGASPDGVSYCRLLWPLSGSELFIYDHNNLDIEIVTLSIHLDCDFPVSRKYATFLHVNFPWGEVVQQIYPKSPIVNLSFKMSSPYSWITIGITVIKRDIEASIDAILYAFNPNITIVYGSLLASQSIDNANVCVGTTENIWYPPIMSYFHNLRREEAFPMLLNLMGLQEVAVEVGVHKVNVALIILCA